MLFCRYYRIIQQNTYFRQGDRMKQKCVFLLLLMCCIAIHFPALAVDGIAVSSRYFTGGGYEGSTIVKEHGAWWGQIMKHDIKNSAVEKETIVFDGFALNPTISQDGARIAFLRNGSKLNNEDTCGDIGFCGWVSVMDIDGSTVRDLAYLDIATGCIAWPTGDWVYYQLARGRGQQGSDTELSRHIWRVNVNDPSQKNEVAKFTFSPADPDYIRKWDLNANATRGSLQLGGSICAYNFPLDGPVPFSGSDRKDRFPTGCNPCISPSGNYCAYLNGTAHFQLNVFKWDGSGWDWEAMPGMSTTEIWAALGNRESTFPGWGMDWPRYSANSDKWVCTRQGWACQSGCSVTGRNCIGRFGQRGTNQVLVNWVDRKAVQTSKNPYVCTSDNPIAANTAGDFWVAGLDGIETIDGTVVPVESRGGLPLPARVSNNALAAPHAIVVSFSREQRRHLEVFDAAGKALWAGDVSSGCAAIPYPSGARRGVYLIRARSGNSTEIFRVSFAARQ